MKVTVLSNQTLADIAIQVYGSADGVVMLAQENGLNVTDELIVGSKLEYNPDNVIDKQIVNYYARKKIYPATGSTDLEGGIWDNACDLTFN